MSGRSAHVRKEKTKVKEGGSTDDQVHDRDPSLREFPRPPTYQGDLINSQHHHSEISTIRTNSSNGNDDLAYQRVRKPHTPVIDVSGIEKSNLRMLIDRRSEGVRKGLSKAFTSKKKKEAAERSENAQILRQESHELEAGELPSSTTSLAIRSQRNQFSEPDYIRNPPARNLPAVPPGPAIKRWIGHGQPTQPWSKLQKDPELYDPNADTQIFLCREGENKPPSLIVASHVLDNTGSRIFATWLRQGYVDDAEPYNGMPPSPANSPDFRTVFPTPAGRPRHPSPPRSNESYVVDGHTSYRIYLGPPSTLRAEDALRYQITTRNVFALLFGASLVGLSMHQALLDLLTRLQEWMPEEADAPAMILNYIKVRGLLDVRNNPSSAAGLLAFFEHPLVRDVAGWRETYIHACGMYTQVVEARAEYLHISPITRAIMERGNLDIEVRVHDCELVLQSFDFDSVWSTAGVKNVAHPESIGRSAFNRLRQFFVEYYTPRYGSWPPSTKNSQDQWLTRNVARQLGKDFAALYDYLVNREVIWDSSEERAGRKWHIVHPGRKFEPDSDDFQFTDVVVAFDNERRYPHIPLPYPLVPEENAGHTNSRETLFKPVKKGAKVDENIEKMEKIAEKKAALAYTNSTNIYLLGADYVHNDLVDAFLRFEKQDRPGLVDPHNARRGRWILIYCILQTLATVTVDTPGLQYTDVDYYLNPKLGPSMPPWKGQEHTLPEATHTLSHCWSIRQKWFSSQPVASGRRPQLPTLSGLSALAERGNYGRSGLDMSAASSDAGSSMRSPTLTNMSTKSAGRRGNRLVPREYDGGRTGPSQFDGTSYTGYTPGIEKIEDWPAQEQSRRYYEEKMLKTSSREASRSRKREGSHPRQSQQASPMMTNSPMGEFVIKDFDNWPEDDWAGGHM